MKSIGAFEAKTHLSKYLDQVEHHHQEIVIQRRGKNIARLLPYENTGFDKNQRKDYILTELKTIRKKSKSIDTKTALLWAKQGRK